MGAYLSFDTTQDDIIDDIIRSEKFNEYRIKFELLNPSRNLYFEDGDIVIETGVPTSYCMSRIEINWMRDDIEDFLYRYLDDVYETYRHSEELIKNIVGTDNRSESDGSGGDYSDDSDDSDDGGSGNNPISEPLKFGWISKYLR